MCARLRQGSQKTRGPDGRNALKIAPAGTPADADMKGAADDEPGNEPDDMNHNTSCIQ
jgi:hypothetical protein